MLAWAALVDMFCSSGNERIKPLKIFVETICRERIVAVAVTADLFLSSVSLNCISLFAQQSLSGGGTTLSGACRDIATWTSCMSSFSGDLKQR